MSDDERSEARPVAPIEYTAQLSAPLLGLFGNDDTHPSPEQVNLHEAELERHGKTLRVLPLRRGRARLLLPHTPMYRPQPAMDGWEKVFSFFRRHLG